VSVELATDYVLALALGSVRVLALLTAAPIFGHLAVPVRVRAALAPLILLAVGAPPALPFDPVQASPAALFLAAGAEVVIGVTLGFAARLVFAAFSLFGDFVSVQAGLGHARVLDPSTGSTSVALATLFDLFLIAIYLAIGGHLQLLEGVVRSFEALPVGGAGLGAEPFVQIALLGSRIFEIALRLAAPVTVAMMVSNAALGILARAIPQLNLMMLQLPAHVALGLVLLGLGSGSFVRAAARELEGWSQQVFGAMVGG
jgi:flagellar biosynthetic protein FliR